MGNVGESYGEMRVASNSVTLGEYAVSTVYEMEWKRKASNEQGDSGVIDGRVQVYVNRQRRAYTPARSSTLE